MHKHFQIIYFDSIKYVWKQNPNCTALLFLFLFYGLHLWYEMQIQCKTLKVCTYILYMTHLYIPTTLTKFQSKFEIFFLASHDSHLHVHSLSLSLPLSSLSVDPPGKNKTQQFLPMDQPTPVCVRETQQVKTSNEKTVSNEKTKQQQMKTNGERQKREERRDWWEWVIASAVKRSAALWINMKVLSPRWSPAPLYLPSTRRNAAARRVPLPSPVIHPAFFYLVDFFRAKRFTQANLAPSGDDARQTNRLVD